MVPMDPIMNQELVNFGSRNVYLVFKRRDMVTKPEKENLSVFDAGLSDVTKMESILNQITLTKGKIGTTTEFRVPVLDDNKK